MRNFFLPLLGASLAVSSARAADNQCDGKLTGYGHVADADRRLVEVQALLSERHRAA